MAIPTITTISPSTGSTGDRQVVVITGTNFKTASLDYDVPADAPAATVRVLFDGIACETVRVLSATSIQARVPDYRGSTDIAALADEDDSRVTFPAVSVVLSNLADNGTVIPGETVTKTSAYTYSQPLIRLPGGDPPLLQVLRVLIQMLKRRVVSRVAKSTHTAYGDEGEAITALASNPSVGLLRIAYPLDKEYSQDNNRLTVPVAGNRWVTYDAPRTHMITTDVMLSAKHDSVVQHMVSETLDVLTATPWLYVPVDTLFPVQPIDGYNRYPIELTQEPEQVETAAGSDLHAFVLSLRIRGIPVYHSAPISGYIYRTSTIYLTDTTMDGTTLNHSVV